MRLKAVFLAGKVAEFTDSYHFQNILCCMWKSKNIKSTPKTFKTGETALQKNFHKRKQNCTAFLSFSLPKIFIQMGNYLHLYLNSHGRLSFNFTPYTCASHIPAHASLTHVSVQTLHSLAPEERTLTNTQNTKFFHAPSLFTHIYTQAYKII